MVITLASFKGGVAKTTSAVHLAAYLQPHGPTLLIDGDQTRSATNWARHNALPFQVADARHAADVSRTFTHIVVDSAAHPGRADLAALGRGVDLLIVPSTPDLLALDAVRQTLDALRAIGTTRYRVLLTMVPPRPSRDGDEARASLVAQHIPLFDASIPRLAAFGKAALAGIVVSEVHDRRAARGWDAYRLVGEELLQQ